MKISLIVTVAGWMLFGIFNAYAAPFAPKVELPDDISNSDISFLEAQTVEKSVVPSQEEVGVPAYPDAKILFTQAGSTTTVKGLTTSLPNRVFLGTSAPLDSVVEFYSDQLEGWSSTKENDTVIFYEENTTDDPVEDLTIPKIIVAPDDPSRNLMPEAETTIDIYYTSPQQEQQQQELSDLTE